MNLPNVKGPIAEASQKLRTQVSKGNELLRLPVDSMQTFQRAIVRRDLWTEENISLLQSIFADDLLAKKFAARFVSEFVPASEETDEDVHFFFDEIQMQLRELNLTLEALPGAAAAPGFSETPQTQPSSPQTPVSGAAAAGEPKSPLTFVIRINNPVVIQVAVATLVVLVGAVWALFNSYYQDKKESLRERYEAEFSALKSKCEHENMQAQSRIKSLEAELSRQANDNTSGKPLK